MQGRTNLWEADPLRDVRQKRIVALDQVDEIFKFGIFINLLLGIFNLIPIPPLDGSHILEYFLPSTGLE